MAPANSEARTLRVRMREAATARPSAICQPTSGGLEPGPLQSRERRRQRHEWPRTLYRGRRELPAVAGVHGGRVQHQHRYFIPAQPVMPDGIDARFLARLGRGPWGDEVVHLQSARAWHQRAVKASAPAPRQPVRDRVHHERLWNDRAPAEPEQLSTVEYPGEHRGSRLFENDRSAHSPCRRRIVVGEEPTRSGAVEASAEQHAPTMLPPETQDSTSTWRRTSSSASLARESRDETTHENLRRKEPDRLCQQRPNVCRPRIVAVVLKNARIAGLRRG